MKTCTKCRVEKDLSSFPFRNKSKNTLQSQCKDCLKKQTNDHYYRNKPYYFERNSKRREEVRNSNKAFILEYLKEHPCVDCKEADPVVLQFDHVWGNKKKCVAVLVHNGFSHKAIMEEVLKCEVRCANCHLRKTFNQFGWYDKSFK